MVIVKKILKVGYVHMEDKKSMDERKFTNHHIIIQNRKIIQLTGIKDVISFDEKEVILETIQGVLTIKGNELHVSRLTVEKGEADLEGMIDSFFYQAFDTYRKPGESLLRRMLR